jgi:hypothetical protein
VAYWKACRQVNKEIIRSRQEFYSENESTLPAGADSRKRWSAMHDVLHLTDSSDRTMNARSYLMSLLRFSSTKYSRSRLLLVSGWPVAYQIIYSLIQFTLGQD